MLVFFDYVSKRDARLLVKWWNAHTPYYHFRRAVTRDRWQVVRQLGTK